MKKLIVLLLVAMMIIPVLPATAQEDAVVTRLEEYGANLPQGYGVTSVDDLVTLLAEEGDNVVLLDVRQPEEYEGGHIEGSILVPLRTLGQNLNLLPDLDAPIVVICKGGFRAMIGGATLQFLGYTDVKILKGGYDAWVGEDYPVVTEPSEAEAGEVPAIDETLITAADEFLSNLPEGWDAVRAPDLATEVVEDPPILIDVRSEDEWNNGYIEGAQHIWINDFMASMDQWPEDKDANIVVYCASSYRGGVAYVMMSLMGYTNVRNLAGGINAWIAADLPVVGAQEEEAAFDAESYFATYLEGMPASFNALRVSELEEKFANEEDFVLVDVRTDDEFAEGFIEGAIHIPLNEVTQHLDLLPDLNADIVIYCGSGHRSTMAMAALNALGYENATSLLGGTRAWTAAELPLTTEPIDVEPGTAPEFDPELFAIVDEFITNIPQGYYAVRADDLNTELIESDTPPVLIDVRTAGERDSGFIEGSIHIELRDLMTSMDQLPEDKTTPIVTIGNPSHRGALAMSLLRMVGYENVRSLAGGVGAWESAGLPLAE